MTVIIKCGSITESEFHVIAEADADINHSNALLPLACYLDNADRLEGRNDIGVWLDSHEEVEGLAPYVNHLPVIALNFPLFHDGRPFSSATILRRHYRYGGELRAIGDVRRDMVNEMHRCGFDAFEPAEDQTPEQILEGLAGFTYAYQSAMDRPGPLFRLRS